MRQDERNDFLSSLASANFKQIAYVMHSMIGATATDDLIRNEGTQQFFLGANRAIDQFNPIDDGRGNSTLEGFCRWKGLNAVKDWCRKEYGSVDGQQNRSPQRYFERLNIVTESELYVNIFQFQAHLSQTSEDSIVSLIVVQEMIKQLAPLDRSILQLLIFGYDEFGSIRNSSMYGSPYHSIAGDIALTVGRSKQYVYSRLAELRKDLAERLVA